MSTLSTHVLDMVSGRPAPDLAIRLRHGETLIFEGRTDADGRCPPLRALSLPPGAYRLEFAAGDHFRAQGYTLAEPPFLDIIPIAFGLPPDTHAHVPLLVAPHGYSTYRGS